MDMNNGGPTERPGASWPGDDRDLLLWLSDTLREETDPQAILCRTVEALGRRLDVDAAGCAELDVSGEYATVACEWLSGKLSSRKGRYRLLDYGTPEQLTKLLRGETDVIEDVRTDPRLDSARRQALEAEGVLSHISAPLVAGGRLRFIIFGTDTRSRVWTEGDLALIREVAVRTWATLERARAVAALQAAEQNQRFLVRLGDRLRSLTDPMEVLLASAETLGRHLGVNRAGYAEVDLDGTLVIGRDWTDGTVKPGTGRRPIASFGEAVVAKLERGETERFDDATTDPRVQPSHRPAFEEMSIVAILTVPLVKGGRLVGMLSVHQEHARIWTDAEVQLVQDVAERTWAALERARAELALRDSEQQFRLMADNIPALCWMADADGQPFWFNRRWCEFFGVEEGERAAWNSSLSLDPQQASEVEGRWAQALKRQELFEMTLALKGRRGFRTFLTRVEPMRGADGRVARWFGMNTDVTEQIEAERNNAFLLDFGDKARRLTDPAEVLRTSIRMLGEHFAAARVGWAEVEADGLTIDVAHDWTDGVDSVAGRHPLAAFGALHRDSASRPDLPDGRRQGDRGSENWPVYEAMQIRAAVTVPLFKQDRFVALLSVHHTHTYAWTDAEVRLIEEVAERTWSAHEWARAEMG
jgi:PAS domain S-box-containing protein